MGGVRSIVVHPDGKTMVAVGLGRFAHVYTVGKKTEKSRVYLKQKLCTALFSEEASTWNLDKDDDSCSDATGLADEEVDGLAEGAEDVVQEGFSDDEIAEENKS